MNNGRDIHTISTEVPIEVEKKRVGTSVNEYEVREFTDLRNLQTSRAYMVTCRQRLLVPSNQYFALGSVEKYDSYPAVVLNAFRPVTTKGDLAVTLHDYFPKTLNTAVVTSENRGSGGSASFSNQHTSGSSTAQTNSYDVSASAGLFGDIASGSVSASYGHSTTDETSQSRSTGRSTGVDSQVGDTHSMSIKDWGSYASIDAAESSVSWTWGQEYPWNVLQFHNADAGDQGYIALPAFVQARLFDGSQVLPPSDLALYGVNFQSHAAWIINVPDNVDAEELFQIDHEVDLYTASHGIDDKSHIAQMSKLGSCKFQSSPLDLCTLALDAIPGEGPDNGAIVGFNRREFIKPPAGSAGFRIKSTVNNLYVTGAGFNAPVSDNAPMETDFSDGEVEVNVAFKVISRTDEYALILKHWKTRAAGCRVSIVVNGDTENAITRHVDALEAGNGADNIISIILRSRIDMTSDYFDYLQLGLNTLKLTIIPSYEAGETGVTESCGYALRALAIG
jgi:hypothetical protein